MLDFLSEFWISGSMYLFLLTRTSSPHLLEVYYLHLTAYSKYKYIQCHSLSRTISVLCWHKEITNNGKHLMLRLVCVTPCTQRSALFLSIFFTYVCCLLPHRFALLIRMLEIDHSFRSGSQNRFQFLLGKVSGISLNCLACLASVALETRWASFKGQLSSGETVAQPCQNHQPTEKRSKGGKDPKSQWWRGH